MTGTRTKKTLKTAAAAVGVAAMVLLPTGCAEAAGTGGGGLVTVGGGTGGGILGTVGGILG
jgi:hypothetical protein